MDLNTVFGTASGIIAGVLVTLLGSRLLDKQADLRYEVSVSEDFVPEAPITLDVSYAGAPVKSLVLIRVRFSNRGRLPIHDVPVTYTARTKNAYVGPICAPADSITADQQGHVTLLLLNPGESCTAEFVAIDDLTPQIDIAARSIGVIARRVRPSVNDRSERITNALAGLQVLVVGWALILTLIGLSGPAIVPNVPIVVLGIVTMSLAAALAVRVWRYYH